ncbi:MAG: hypothetical protein H6734_04830 [Alphaproteobacteria bacterium]|nr:hypothetical protein [Alphaproteobacteria bacterium]
MHYLGTAAMPWPANSRLDVSLPGGQWSPFDAADVLPVPPEVDITSPARFERVRLTAGQSRTIEWVPASGPHVLTLEIHGADEPGAASVHRLITLEDDGEHTVDVDALGLRPANRELTFTLARTSRADLDVGDDPLALAARIETSFTAEHPPVQGRTQVPAASVCTGSPVLVDGAYYGYLDAASNDHDPGNDGCTGANAPGADAVFQVPLEPGERVRIEGRRVDGDLALYLVESCAALETCVASASEAPIDHPEVLVYTNASDTPVTRYLVVDSPSWAAVSSTPWTSAATSRSRSPRPTAVGARRACRPSSAACTRSPWPGASTTWTPDRRRARSRRPAGATSCCPSWSRPETCSPSTPTRPSCSTSWRAA